MADRTIDILTPATNTDLLTVEECKKLLGMNVADVSEDEQLELLISVYSETCAEICNRTFAKEEVLETWREIGNGRIFLSHWPVKQEDMQSVRSNNYDVSVGQYELEELSGKVSNIGLGGAQSANWGAPVVVHYSGGYNLPDEAPKPLKQACALMIQQHRTETVQAQTAGVRQIRHKGAMVSFFDPNSAMQKSSSGKSPQQSTIESLLKQYMRFEV